MSARLPDQTQPPSQQDAQTDNRAAPGGSGFQTQPSQGAGTQNSSYSTLGGAQGGAAYDSMAGSSPASFSDSSYGGMGVSPVFETEPAYTTGVGVNGASHLNGGMFQFGAVPNEDWGPLMALNNPKYWQDMMMPGYVRRIPSIGRST